MKKSGRAFTIACVTHTPAAPARQPFGLEPAVIGLACGIFSAAIYTCANICLREVVHCDPFWVSCVKALPTTLLAGVLVAHRMWRGRAAFPDAKIVWALIATGLFVQLGGNAAFQYSLGVVGLALGVPLTLGTLIIGGALLGRVWLLEPVTPRSALAMLLLIGSIIVLSLGADRAYEAITPSHPDHANPWLLFLGVGAACGSGVAYAFLGVVIRRMVTSETPLSATLFIISTTGVVSLGLASIWHVGTDVLWSTSAVDLGSMFWAGVFNAVAFFALSKALEFAPVVQVNAVNASQTAMAALAGIVFFDEPPTRTLAIGIGLTILGLLLIDRPKRAQATRSIEEVSLLASISDAPTVESEALPDD
jgi:DME family drug/metabolite transporter